MKRLLTLLGCLVGGLLTGGGAAFAVTSLYPSEQAPAEASPQPLHFVPAGTILTPLVFDDGQLAGYASIEVQLQVSGDDAEAVAARMPLLLHAINLQTYRTPLAAGPDGQLPDLRAFRRLVLAAAEPAFGRGTVRQVAITQARPA